MLGHLRSRQRSAALLCQVAVTLLVPCVLSEPAVQLQPAYETLDGLLGKIEVIWQKPEQPKGVLLLFHGCGGTATSFFPKTDACQNCTGLPEDVRITTTVLQQQLAPVAVSSSDRADHKCWYISNRKSSPSPDDSTVMKVVTELLPKLQLDKLPLYAFGASSGGAFALSLPIFLPLAGVVSQIMALDQSLMQDVLDALEEDKRQHPPTAFVHMPKDVYRAKQVHLSSTTLGNKGVAVQTWEVAPAALTKEYLVQRLGHHMAPAAAEKALQALARLVEGVMDEKGMLKKNPRKLDWAALAAKDPDIAAMAKINGFNQILNLAWAEHEIVSDPVPEVLQWLLSQPASKT